MPREASLQRLVNQPRQGLVNQQRLIYWPGYLCPLRVAFEVIGLDLYIVALLAALALGLLWRRGQQPLFIYYSTAYGLGLVATALYKGISG